MASSGSFGHVAGFHSRKGAKDRKGCDPPGRWVEMLLAFGESVFHAKAQDPARASLTVFFLAKAQKTAKDMTLRVAGLRCFGPSEVLCF